MIYFVAPNPAANPVHNGYLRRVADIDNVFNNFEKQYFYDIDSNEARAGDIAAADLIYVHSIYMAQQILPLYKICPEKIITDLHGVVPEEEEYQGNSNKSLEMTEVETEVFKHGKIFIAVTQKMVAHFTKKYNLSSDVKWIVLPVFSGDDQLSTKKLKRYEAIRKIIYAGGIERWQKPSLMVEAVTKRSDLRYVFYVHEKAAFNELLLNAGTTNVHINTGLRDKVVSHYKKCDAGFILRDEHIVNDVACPTKLIEYLKFGVIPIVLSPNIGDFVDLGYSYISYDDFINDTIPKKILRNATRNNYAVAEKIKQITKDGISNLMTIADGLINSKTSAIDKLTIEIALQCAGQQMEMKNTITALNQLQQTLAERDVLVASLRVTISDMLASRRWLLGEVINTPRRFMKYIELASKRK